MIANSGKLKSLKRIDVEKSSKVVRRDRPTRVGVGPRGRARIRSRRGPLIATRTQDKIEKDGDSRTWFDSKKIGDTNSFDFKADKHIKTLRFVLSINGKSKPAMIYLGENKERSSRTTFAVSLE